MIASLAPRCDTGPPRVPRRRGFSLIEALIVLLVAGMALMLVFAIGGHSARTGFALGRRALAAADREVADDQVRSLIVALRLAPARLGAAALRIATFAGDARGFSGEATLARAGPCGAAGPTGRLVVAIVSRPDGDVVTCRAGAAPATVAADLSPRRLRFSYSSDGSTWRDAWSAPDLPYDRNAQPTEQALYIRLASDDGQVDVVARATSGPGWLYPKPDPTP